jgi:uncharacterized protein with HEPN domain
MRPESRILLQDMLDAAKDVSLFVQGRTYEQYQSDRQLKWSVERGYEIIGEALAQLSKLELPLAERISDRRKIISFRNILIHGYRTVSDPITWEICQKDLPILIAELQLLLTEA